MPLPDRQPGLCPDLWPPPRSVYRNNTDQTNIHVCANKTFEQNCREIAVG